MVMKITNGQKGLAEEISKLQGVIFRLEQPEDFCAVEELVRDAFWNLFVPGCCEHYLTHILRESKAFLPELDFVAVLDGNPIGCVMAAKGVIECDSGARREVVTVGPIAVAPAYQRQGVGGQLLGHVKRAARSMGYEALLLCGDPNYYGKQGFLPAERFGIRTDDNHYAAALQAFPLSEGALQGASGRYREDEVYFVEEAAVEAFDRQFPPREQASGTESQKRFQEIVSMRKAAE